LSRYPFHSQWLQNNYYCPPESKRYWDETSPDHEDWNKRGISIPQRYNIFMQEMKKKARVVCYDEALPLIDTLHGKLEEANQKGILDEIRKCLADNAFTLPFDYCWFEAKMVKPLNQIISYGPETWKREYLRPGKKIPPGFRNLQNKKQSEMAITRISHLAGQVRDSRTNEFKLCFFTGAAIEDLYVFFEHTCDFTLDENGRNPKWGNSYDCFWPTDKILKYRKAIEKQLNRPLDKEDMEALDRISENRKVINSGYMSQILALLHICNSNEFKLIEKKRERKNGSIKGPKKKRFSPCYYEFKTRNILDKHKMASYEEGSGSRQAYHFVKNHWCYYPQHLFNDPKKPQWIFKPEHSKGNPEIGIIVKDYEVDPN
jgi:hypothetical protein|tara:strand:- start:679 stop:1797 length:1119 start_codon:yes stop_codon:yes gene_type:complete